jgi:hypothetical protein
MLDYVELDFKNATLYQLPPNRTILRLLHRNMGIPTPLSQLEDFGVGVL